MFLGLGGPAHSGLVDVWLWWGTQLYWKTHFKRKELGPKQQHQCSCGILYGVSINLTMINCFIFNVQWFDVVTVQRNDPCLIGLKLEKKIIILG